MTAKKIIIREDAGCPDSLHAVFLALSGPERRVAFWAQLIGQAVRGKANSSVLELGCGCGNLANPLAQSGFDVTAIDCNPHAIEIAQNQNKHGVKFITANFLDPWNGRYNFIFLRSCVFNTINAKARVTLGKNIWRSLVPQGTFALEIYDANWLLNNNSFKNDAQTFVFTRKENKKCGLIASYHFSNEDYILRENIDIIEEGDLSDIFGPIGFSIVQPPIRVTPLSILYRLKID